LLNPGLAMEAAASQERELDLEEFFGRDVANNGIVNGPDQDDRIPVVIKTLAGPAQQFPQGFMCSLEGREPLRMDWIIKRYPVRVVRMMRRCGSLSVASTRKNDELGSSLFSQTFHCMHTDSGAADLRNWSITQLEGLEEREDPTCNAPALEYGQALRDVLMSRGKVVRDDLTGLELTHLFNAHFPAKNSEGRKFAEEVSLDAYERCPVKWDHFHRVGESPNQLFTLGTGDAGGLKSVHGRLLYVPLSRRGRLRSWFWYNSSGVSGQLRNTRPGIQFYTAPEGF
jgi:hypothetical protein